jgi:hypothetical protein
LLPATTFCGGTDAEQNFQKVTAGISEASHLEEEVRAGLRCCRSVSGLLFVLGVSLSDLQSVLYNRMGGNDPLRSFTTDCFGKPISGTRLRRPPASERLAPKPKKGRPGCSTNGPGEMRSRSGGALAGRCAGRAGPALACGTTLAGGPTRAGHRTLVGGDACCGRIRIKTFGDRVHLMLPWIGDWTRETLSTQGGKQLNETAIRAERSQARFRTSF